MLGTRLISVNQEKVNQDHEPERMVEPIGLQASVVLSQLKVKLTRLPASVLQHYIKDTNRKKSLDGDADSPQTEEPHTLDLNHVQSDSKSTFSLDKSRHLVSSSSTSNAPVTMDADGKKAQENQDLRVELGLHTELDIKLEPGEELKEEPQDPMDHDHLVDDDGLLQTIEHILKTNDKHIHDHEDYLRLSKKQRKRKSKKTDTNNQNKDGTQSKIVYNTRARKKNENITDSKKDTPAISDVSTKPANDKSDGFLQTGEDILHANVKHTRNHKDYSRLSRKQKRGSNKESILKNHSKAEMQSKNINNFTTRARKKNENKNITESNKDAPAITDVSGETANKKSDSKFDDSEKNKKSKIKISNTSSGNNFSCTKCVFTTDIERDFKSHVNAHSAVINYSCDKCPYITTIGINLYHHIRRRHTNYDYACKLCSKKYRKLASLNRHSTIHTGGNSKSSNFNNLNEKVQNTKNKNNNCANLSTHICDDAVFAVRKLDERKNILAQDGKKYSELHHLRSHLGKKLHACKMCDKKFARNDALGLHVRLTHKNERACKVPHLKEHSDLFLAKYSCSKCKYTTNCANYLETHLKAHTATKKYICDLCPYITNDKQMLIRHIRVHNGEKPLKCDICDKKFRDRYKLIVHIRRHTGEKPYACKLCDRKFVDSYGATLHMKSHTGDKKYACKICDKKFVTPSGFNSHVRTHIGEKPYSCKICSKRFYRNYVLNAHVRLTHKGEKLYGCEICSKTFGQRSYLKIHIRTHTGEKPYACTICDKKFRDHSSLYDHKRLHTGEKPHACNLCDMKFITSSALTNHLRTHTGEKPYSCKICSREFARTITLKNHMVIHTGGKPFACEKCNKTYRRESTLKAHTSTHV